jgi:hypothetical protein
MSYDRLREAVKVAEDQTPASNLEILMKDMGDCF